MNLQIVELEVALAHELRISSEVTDRADKIFVVLSADGRHGWGEASVKGGGAERGLILAYLVAVKRFLQVDPLAYRSTIASIDSSGLVCPAARMAVEMALLDLAGKLLNMPTFRLLGVDPLATKELCYTIGIDTIDNMVAASVAAASFHKALKVKVGTNFDADIIREICGAVTVPVRVDVNGGWSFERATEMIERVLAPAGVQILEQPLPQDDSAGQRLLHEMSPVPIYLDESISGLSSVVEAVGSCAGIDVKLAKCGGVMVALDMIACARSLGMGVMIGCEMETSLAISAATMLTPLADYADLDLFLRLVTDPFTGLRLANGRFVLSSAAGLGVSAGELLQSEVET